MSHALVVQPVGQVARDVGRAVVGEQPRPITVAWSQPEATSASSSVSVTSAALIVVQSRQATM
jgi:hypothetical protein